MPKLINTTPKYRKHKASGQAIVTLNGLDHYLGPWKSRASHREYDRLVAEWIARGRVLPKAGPDLTLSVAEIVTSYLRWAKTYYLGDSHEVDHIIFTVRPLKELYGTTNANEFGPLALKAVRERMIANNVCRTEINKRIGRIKRIFAWAVENELLPSSVFHGLQAVRGLAHGRSAARESEPVKPVPEAFIEALDGRVAPQIWAMIQLQKLTGMRPGEVTIMRGCDLDTSGQVWIYTPRKHKTQRHGHRRQIFLGPRAQSILRPWLRTELNAYLFQPKEAVEWQLAERAKNRTTSPSCGNRPGSNRVRLPKRRPREFYAVGAYGHAINYGCKKAGVPHWHPHQLRHNAATWLRKEFGLDVARVVLGHRSPQITETYAELDFAKAMRIMGDVG